MKLPVSFCVVTVACLFLNVALAEEILSRDDYELREKIRLSPLSFAVNTGEIVRVNLRPGGAVARSASRVQRLDGTWVMRCDGTGDCLRAEIPCSVQTALNASGRLPDPYFGDNAIEARFAATRHSWLFTRNFRFEGPVGSRQLLRFDGVCDRSEYWLNGVRLGTHQGMFGGPDFDVTDKLKVGDNVLEVRLEPALPWDQTVVFNCSYGWHYSQIVPLGIWRGVRLESVPSRSLGAPFVTVQDARKGDVSVVFGDGVVGCLAGVLSPANFQGGSWSFSVSLTGVATRVSFAIPEPRLWWPNGHGRQDLYRLDLSLKDGKGHVCDVRQIRFGLRDIKFRPSPANPAFYRRLTVVNGRELQLKGSNWCTIDALMRFGRPRYVRFLSMARDQGVNWLRAWGGGLVETDEFYDLCDEYGILVMQEWQTAWCSRSTQPVDVMRETVDRNVRRLRNHPSLAIWCGGNEGGLQEDPLMWPVLARRTMQGDGSRPFYTLDNNMEPNSQVCHYHIRWARAYPESVLESRVAFTNCLHEWGNDALMIGESVKKVVPGAELKAWPIDPNGSLAYHTATFNYGAIHGRVYGDPTACYVHRLETGCLDRYTGDQTGTDDISVQMTYARTFLDDARLTSYDAFALASQLVQTMTLAPAVAVQRAMWPYVPSFAYYKLNDVAPGASWSVIDWFGATKPAYWFVKAFMRPLVALPALPTFEFKADADVKIPIHLVDDAGALANVGWEVRARLFGPRLQLLREERFSGSAAPVKGNSRIGELKAAVADLHPFFVVVDLAVRGMSVARSWLPLNYSGKRGCLFDIPKTRINVRNAALSKLLISNAGSVPAVGVRLLAPDFEHCFRPEDNLFWLDPGEERRVRITFDDGASHAVNVMPSVFELPDRH